MKRLYESARSVFINHPAVDYAFAAVIGAAYIIGRAWFGDHFPQVDPARRAVMLQTLSGLAVAIVGVSATVVAIIATLTPTERLRELMKEISVPLGRIVLGALVAVGGAALGFALLIGLDVRGRVWPWVLTAALVGLLLARAIRLIWILTRLFILSTTTVIELPNLPEELDVPFDASQYGLEQPKTD